MKIDCKNKALSIKNSIKKYIEMNDIKPSLHIIQVGYNEASSRYIRGKLSDCKEVGIECELHKLDKNITENEVVNLIKTLNTNANVDGIIVQLPLPKHINEKTITNIITKEKDVDGFKLDSQFTPCTPKGVMKMLEDIELDGKNVTIVGRSDIVGKPLIPLLLNENANVTICHSHTSKKDLVNFINNSDVLITATGNRNAIDYKLIDKGITIIDVGINFDDIGKLCGDIYHRDIASILENDYNITPVPNGLGLMTRACILENTLEAYEYNMKEGD